MYFKFTKTRNVKTPIRANPGDCLDLFLPEADELAKIFGTPTDRRMVHVYDPVNQSIVIRPHSNLVIPAGIKLEIPYGYAVLVKNKSGIASKRELIKGSQVIDHGYSGEIIIDLHNIGNENQYLEAGKKMVQLMVIPVITPCLIEVEEDELYKDVMVASARGDEGFGSTGS